MGCEGTTFALDESSQDGRETGRAQSRFVGFPKHRYSMYRFFGNMVSRREIVCGSGEAKRQSGSGEIGEDQQGAVNLALPCRHGIQVDFDSRLAEIA